MKFRILAYWLIISTAIPGGCGKSKDIEEQRYTWSTDAPLSIPLRARVQRYERANMVRNPSFETGKIFRIDSATTSYAIEGWQQVGQHVQWVDILNDSIYKSNEVFSGSRSVKISRIAALETDDKGEGILSDFIKVIPGNYSLSFFARMENVMPQRARMGTRMYDGVDISIQYYDRNKNIMDPGFNYPQKGQRINSSQKSLSFANYKKIASFGWNKVIGKSCSFPFPEGDIPSEAHFIKIYIGLKCSGTLWVDSITFKYTDRNFSIAERMQPFTDTAFHTPEVIIPTPRKVTRMESIIFLKPELTAGQMPVIVAPRIMAETEKQALSILREALKKNMTRFSNKSDGPGVVNELTAGQLENSRLIFSIGITDVYDRFRKVLPEQDILNHRQGYFIYTPGDYPNLVILGAGDDEGLCYAALTAEQMFDNKAPVFHNARIVDYPDFQYRYVTMENQYHSTTTTEQAALAGELIRYKLNGAFHLKPGAVENNPGNNLPDPGLFTMIPVQGYYPPDNSSLTYNYPFTFNDNTVISGSYEKYLIPPVFHNEMLDNSDYSDMCCEVPVNGKLLYSGCSFFSISTDAADIERFTSVMGSDPVFFDNSMRISTVWGHYDGNDLYYPGKLRIYNIFEPFMNPEIKEFFNKLDSSMFVVNLPPASEIEIVRLATAAEFMWNASVYSRDYALWRVLMSRYGAENARDLVIYADKYGLLLEVIRRTEMNLQAARNAKTGQQTMAEITDVLSDISSRLGSQNKLVKELQLLNIELRNRLNKSISMMPVKK